MKLLIICGPTATGKTKLAVLMAKKFHGELINADSRQVYRHMDIATGKDKKDIDVPIWGLDIVDPRDDFSVSQFVTYATDKIQDITSRGKLPIIVGGTGFYIDALVSPFETLHIPPNKKLRDKFKNFTVEALQKELQEEVLLSMNQSDRNNPRRLIRKIEISKLKNKIKGKRIVYEVLFVGLTATNGYLYAHIDKRVDERVKMGVKGEVEFLVNTYGWGVPSINTLGYKEWRDKEDHQAIAQWKKDEQDYARRQVTWFKKNKAIVWFHIEESEYVLGVEKLVSAWYT